MASSRTDFLKAAKRVAEERLAIHEGEGQVYVKRGAINWAAFDWDSYPRALAIMVDDSSVWPTNRGFRDANVTFECFAKMPERQGIPDIDDDLQEEIIDDVTYVVSQLKREKNVSSQPVVTRVDEANARIIESHDVNLQVQGVVVTLNINY